MREVKKFRKKPVVIEAVRFNGWNAGEINDWMYGTGKYPTYFVETIDIETLEGVMIANVGDYIIKGVQGEFYPCKPDIFKQTYDELKEE